LFYESLDSKSQLLNSQVHQFVNLVSEFTDVFYYKFSYVGDFSLFTYPRNDSIYGVQHGDDLHYVIPYRAFDVIGGDHEDNFIVERLSRIYENFARNGNPNNATDEYLNEMHWEAFDPEKANYLDIGRHMIEKNGLFLERYARWEQFGNAGNNMKLCFFTALIAFLYHLL